MSRIESRPSKRELGEYVFFVDVELGSEGSGRCLAGLIEDLEPFCEHLAHFGAYPKHGADDQRSSTRNTPNCIRPVANAQRISSSVGVSRRP